MQVYQLLVVLLYMLALWLSWKWKHGWVLLVGVILLTLFNPVRHQQEGGRSFEQNSLPAELPPRVYHQPRDTENQYLNLKRESKVIENEYN